VRTLNIATCPQPPAGAVYRVQRPVCRRKIHLAERNDEEIDGLALVAIGAILLPAVNVPLAFVGLRLAGLVLVTAGLAGLRVPQRACRWLDRHQNELKDALGWLTEPAPEGSARVPLDDLLQPESFPQS
jgi:hypothetical protein